MFTAAYEGTTVVRPGEKPHGRMPHGADEFTWFWEYADCQGNFLSPPATIFAKKLGPIESLVAGDEYGGWWGRCNNSFSVKPYKNREEVQEWIERHLWDAGVFDIAR